MLQVIRFLLHTIIDFIRMLFTIDIGNNMSLGLIMCIVFIFLPMMLRIIGFLKRDAIEELDDRFDESRPRETSSSVYSLPVKFSDGSTITTRHSITRSRRKRWR